MPNKTSFFIFSFVSNPFLNNGFDKNSQDFRFDSEVGEKLWWVREETSFWEPSASP